MAVIKHGNLSIAQGPTTYRWKPFVGGSTQTSWEGDWTLIVSQTLVYRHAGWETESIYNGNNKGTLTATLNSDLTINTDPNIIWEIQDTPSQQSILEATDRPIVANLSTTTKAAIEAQIKSPEKTIPLITNDTISELDNALKVYNLMRIGLESKLSHIITVRRTIIVPYQYTPTWTLANVEKVLSKNAFVSEYLVPNYLIPILPDSDSSIQIDQNGVETFKGFLVHFPNYTTTSQNKVQVTQDFVWFKWSAGPNGLYDVVGA